LGHLLSEQNTKEKWLPVLKWNILDVNLEDEWSRFLSENLTAR
jgi:hypothetical protein